MTWNYYNMEVVLCDVEVDVLSHGDRITYPSAIRFVKSEFSSYKLEQICTQFWSLFCMDQKMDISAVCVLCSMQSICAFPVGF